MGPLLQEVRGRDVVAQKAARAQVDGPEVLGGAVHQVIEQRQLRGPLQVDLRECCDQVPAGQVLEVR
eukprot:5404509-Alexandrium_andersonii.AAC.1